MTGDVAVLGALRAAILDGEFAAGQRLVEVDLCERFGATRFAVRAAIPVLAGEGLISGAPPGLSRTAGTGCPPSARPCSP